MRLLPFAILLLLAGCGGLRKPVMSVDQARADHRTVTLRILAVHASERIAGPSPGASHLIEVACQGGDDSLRGRSFTLPYDEWNVGAAPPAAGTVVTTTPAAWVDRSPRSKGVPTHGWDR